MMTAKRASGWWYPWLFVGGMGVVVVVNGILVYFALGTWTGLETDDHYKKGLAYNQDLAATQAQQERGWEATLTVGDQAQDGRLFGAAVTFRDIARKPLDGLTVRLRAERPTHEGYDTAVEMTPHGGGLYKGRIVLALPGQWAMRLVAARGKDQFQTVERIQVP